MYSIIGKLKLQTIENAKTLQMGWYGGLPYATSKDITEDDLMVIFLPDGQLSKEYAKEHDLVAYHDEAGKKRGGFFGKNRKVRPIKLMQGKIRSVGYVASIDTLAFTGYDVSKLKEGDSFDELNSVPICNKFINKQTQNAGNKVSHRREVRGLATHPDTKQFYKEVRNIKAGSLITITLKIDGTSCRVANAYGELNWFERHLSKLGLNVYKL